MRARGKAIGQQNNRLAGRQEGMQAVASSGSQ